MNSTSRLYSLPVLAFSLSLRATHLCLAAPPGNASDPYEHYVRTSEDFRAVKQDKIQGTLLGGDNSLGLKTEIEPIKLRFTHPVRHVRGERNERDLGSGGEFAFLGKQNEAEVLSFEVQ